MITFDKTAISMICFPQFAAEALLHASPAAMRIYLFGLLRPDATIEQLMQELSLSRSEALDGIAELAAKNVLREDGALLAYQPGENATSPAAAPVYENAELNAMLQTLFGDRELTYSDYRAIYECIDVYGLEGPVTLALCEYCIKKHRLGVRLPMSYLKEMARGWARDGVLTIEDANARLLRLDGDEGSAEEVLRLLKINKLPTIEEEKLYQKWTEEWGFSFAAIQSALAETTKVRYPSMKYLDGILKGMYARGLVSARDIDGYLQETDAVDSNIKELLIRLCQPRLTVSPDFRKKYASWRGLGFGQEEMTFACTVAMNKGRGNLEFVDSLLRKWHSLRLLTVPDIQSYLNRQKNLNAGAGDMLGAAGINKPVSTADETLYTKFTEEYQMPKDVILFAARQAYGHGAPLKAMDKMLSRWHEVGAHTLAAAKAANASFHAPAAGNASQQQGAFLERSYAGGELERKVRDPLAEGGRP